MIIPHISPTILNYIICAIYTTAWRLSNNVMYRVSFRGLYCSSLIFIPSDSRKINFLIRFITTIYSPSYPSHISRSLRLYHIVELYHEFPHCSSSVSFPLLAIPQRCCGEREKCHNFLIFISSSLSDFSGSSSPSKLNHPSKWWSAKDELNNVNAHESGSKVEIIVEQTRKKAITVRWSYCCCSKRLLDHETHKNLQWIRNPHSAVVNYFQLHSFSFFGGGGWKWDRKNKVPVFGFVFISFYYLF